MLILLAEGQQFFKKTAIESRITEKLHWGLGVVKSNYKRNTYFIVQIFISKSFLSTKILVNSWK